MVLVFGMFAAFSATPSWTAQSDIKDTSTSSEVSAEAPPPATKNEPVPENQDSDNTYHNAEVGFSITKPSNWLYMNPELIKTQVSKARLGDEDLQEMIRENPAPLLMITRYPLSTPALNPNVVVAPTFMPSEDFSPKDIINTSLAVFKRSFPDLSIVDEVQDAKVDGIEGAYSKFKYTLSVGDHERLIMARIWLMPRGKIIFNVVMTGAQEGPDVSEEAFKEILSSIKIAR